MTVFDRRDFTKLCLTATTAAPLASAQSPDAIRKAMESVKQAIPRAESDPERPVYHFRPPANWNNDPNGTIFYKGWHHLFYQHHPYGAKWGSMHWGHARSRDMVNWEHLPIAIPPSTDKGEHHVFSGGAILRADGKPCIFYTSIGSRDPEQWMALPEDDDLLVWRKSPANPILTTKLHGAVKVWDWRDPFLFREAGETYMVIGGNSDERHGGGGSVYLYHATNAELTGWRFLGPIFEYKTRAVVNIECPNVFRLGSKWVLLMSPHRACEYFIGNLDIPGRRFIPETNGVLDAGASYASNISFDDKGRTIQWLWGKTTNPPESGWGSVLTMPRILSIGADGYLRQNPPPEFEQLRGAPVAVGTTKIGAQPLVLTDRIKGDCLEIQAEFSGATAATFGVRVRSAGPGNGIVAGYTPSSGNVTAGSVRTVMGRDKKIDLRVFLDKHVMEVFVNGGSVAIFTTVKANRQDLGVEVFAQDGEVTLDSLKAWPLRPARFSLERYRA